MSRSSLEGVRIMHVHTLPVVSGSGINTCLSMRADAAAGAETSLACAPGGRLERLVVAEGMAFHPVPSFVAEISPWKDALTLARLVRLMRRERIEIVHTHNSKGGFLGRLAARLAGVPHIVHTVHGFAFHDREGRVRRWLYIGLERLAVRWCHRMIAISQPMIDWAERTGVAEAERFDRIPSGIEIDRFRRLTASPGLRTSLGIRPDERVIGMVAKLWAGKGHSVLLQAAARLAAGGRHFKVLLVGEGPLEAELRSQSERLGIADRVIFAGFRSDIAEVTSIFDIAVLPSFFEGMGRAALEAMAAGKPIIASAVGGLTEVIEDGQTGYLVPAGDPDALAKKLDCLLTDDELRIRMARRGVERVDEEYSARRMCDQIHQVYLELLQDKPGNRNGPQAFGDARFGARQTSQRTDAA